MKLPDAANEIHGHETGCETLDKVPASMKLLSHEMSAYLRKRDCYTQCAYLLVPELALLHEKEMKRSVTLPGPSGIPEGKQKATLGASLRRSERCSGSNGVISTLAGRPCPAPAASRGEPTAVLAAESQAKIPVAAPVHN